MTMMLKYYALQDDPFSQTSHPAWFFASRSHTTALQTLRESLKAGEALALLLGEPGVGKTFLVHAALAHRDLQHLKLVHLWYPTCSFRETLQIIGWELGLDAVPDDEAQLASTLHRTSYHLSTPICQIFTLSTRPAHDESGWHHSTCDDATWPSGYAEVDRQYCVRPGHAAVPSPATPHIRC